LQLGLSFAVELSRAQSRTPTANEIASIRNCATRNKDNLDWGERRCLFNLVALPASRRDMPMNGLAVTDIRIVLSFKKYGSYV
jgi:hypothetical protein